MGYQSPFTRHVGRWLSAAVLLVAVAATVGAKAGDAPTPFLKEPILIEDQGSFFIGGVPKVTNHAGSPTAGNPAQITIGQMYVQFQIPAKKHRTGWPVIMVHGSTHTGACLESTPDGREGWLPYFLRKGVPTYVVDQAGRGRSGFDQSVIHEGEGRINSGDVAGGTAQIPSFGRITDNGAWTAWFGHLVVPGTATPTTDILTGELAPHGWRPDDPSPPTVHPNPAGYGPEFPIDTVDPRVVARDGAIGPDPFGPDKYYALEYYKQLVPNGEVTLPGSFCAACNPQTLAPSSTWTPFDLALLVERLGGAIVATHSQSGIMGHHLVRILKERGHLDLLKGLITIEGSCSFANSRLTGAEFDKIPYMALKGDYTATSAVCQSAVDTINARRTAGLGTAKAEYVQLDDPRFNGAFDGTTHMMMIGTNNLEVADVILKWVDDNVRSRNRR